MNDSDHALPAHINIFKHGLRQIGNAHQVAAQRVEQVDDTLDAHVQALGVLTHQDIARTKEKPLEQLKHVLSRQSLNQHPDVLKVVVGQIEGVLIREVESMVLSLE